MLHVTVSSLLITWRGGSVTGRFAWKGDARLRTASLRLFAESIGIKTINGFANSLKVLTVEAGNTPFGAAMAASLEIMSFDGKRNDDEE